MIAADVYSRLTSTLCSLGFGRVSQGLHVVGECVCVMDAWVKKEEVKDSDKNKQPREVSMSNSAEVKKRLERQLDNM